MSYTRIIPRDLFNEAKLLKCIGRLCLLIHDRMIPCKMSFDETGEPFEINQLEDGSLTITNLDIKIKNKSFTFKTTINSKSNYPLYVEGEDNGIVEIEVFNDMGEFSKDFITFVKTIKTKKKF